jgi:hypothetical protein
MLDERLALAGLRLAKLLNQGWETDYVTRALRNHPVKM